MVFNTKLMLIASCFVSAQGQEQNLPDPARRGTIPDPDTDICPTAPDDTTKESTLRPVRPVPVPRPWAYKDWCTASEPGQVTNFRVVCRNASYLDFQIADCCVPGDHWQLKGKDWDAAPNTAVTTSPGRPSQYSVPGRIYNYGGTPQNGRALDALVECSYLHGTGLFSAGSYVYFQSDGSCSVTKTEPADTRIDRSP